MTDETVQEKKEREEKERVEKAEKAAAEEARGAKERAESLLDKATEAAERIEAANKVTQDNLTRQEALKVEQTLGGKAEAGAETKEDTPEEYAKKVMANEIKTDDS